MPAPRPYLAASLDHELGRGGHGTPSVGAATGGGAKGRPAPSYIETTRCCYYRRKKRGRLASQVQVPKKMLRVWFDFGASLWIITELLFVPDTALALVSSISSVYLWNHFADGMASNMNWSAVSLMLAFPLQNAIREAYRRREAALHALMGFRAELVNVYLANAYWDWPGTEAYEGRFEDNVPKDSGGRGLKKKPCTRPLKPEHARHVRDLILRILDALQDILFVPRSGHPRNEFACGRREKREVDCALQQGRETCLRLITRLHWATEEMKAAGMPANEASRINQYNMMLTKNFEYLWSFKTYYTPIALRSLLRVVIQILPFFYGPYWLHLANGDPGKPGQRSLTFGCSFSILITSLLIAMNNLAEQVENPFRNNNRDTIRVRDEIDMCRRAILQAEADIDLCWHERMEFEWELVPETPHGAREGSFESLSDHGGSSDELSEPSP